MEEELRKQAVSLIGQGHSVTEVARMLNKSRQWVYKWVDRSAENPDDWYKSRSKAPQSMPNKTDVSMEETIVEIRKKLQAHPYKECGAYPIMHELKGLGLTPPAVATVNRILRKHGMTKRKQAYAKSGIDYPESPLDMQIMDLIGPRYLRGGSRFYLLNIISNETRHAGVYPILTKGAEDITRSVVSFWKDYSIPDFLQMDNELSFKGSNRHPRGLGMLLRTALSLNVIPRFIPMAEPWRNGVIERFNQKVEKTLLMQTHKDFDELCNHSLEFTEVHNREHHYSTLGHRTPLQLDSELCLPLSPLSREYVVAGRPPLDSYNNNEIHFLRLVRSDCKIDVLNTQITVDKSMMHSYVEAVLCINEHALVIYQDGVLRQTVEFAMPVS